MFLTMKVGSGRGTPGYLETKDRIKCVLIRKAGITNPCTPIHRISGITGDDINVLLYIIAILSMNYCLYIMVQRCFQSSCSK